MSWPIMRKQKDGLLLPATVGLVALAAGAAVGSVVERRRSKRALKELGEAEAARMESLQQKYAARLDPDRLPLQRRLVYDQLIAYPWGQYSLETGPAPNDFENYRKALPRVLASSSNRS